MDADLAATLLFSTLRAGVPLLFCALGVLLAERSGMLNLGQEGMMLMGAVTGFIAASKTGNTEIGVLVAGLTGIGFGALFAFLTLVLQTNQVATGLAMTIFGTGLSAFLGENYVGTAIEGIAPLHIPGLSELPLIGPGLFGQDWLLYLAWLLALGSYWLLHRSRAGLKITAVGENPAVAHKIGLPVRSIRALMACSGGLMAGLGGAYLSLVYTPLWTEGMTAGRGWIALALVVLAGWRTGLVLVAAHIFGMAGILNLLLQGAGIPVSGQIMAMAPYLLCIVALVLLSRQRNFSRYQSPPGLGQNFYPDS
ncbi:ABC transporter permease [Haliea sp. E17]|uniref:ABC transporter permease n=1 Tax=Haliea sp. E17 TaxID=3401576 RepID=UPI003AACD1A2